MLYPKLHATLRRHPSNNFYELTIVKFAICSFVVVASFSWPSAARAQANPTPVLQDPQHRFEKPDISSLRVLRFTVEDDYPPFGFALFFLRSVAPKSKYIDKITKRQMDPVTTEQIYWGAVPFVIIQLIMVGLVITFPQMVMHYKNGAVIIDEKKAMEQFQIAPAGGDLPAIDLLAPPKSQ